MFDSIRQQIHVSNFETTDLRVCLGAIFKRKAKKQNLCFCLQIIHGYLFPFFVSLEPHVERPEESVKIAKVDSQRKRAKERRPQAPFGPSVDSLCHL